MSVALTNIDVLHRGWEDAVTEITPHLPEVRATMETRYAGAVHDDRLDEESLLDAVREITTVVARIAGADTARLLSRALHRVVYEFLLSLDASTDEETAAAQTATGIEIDPSRMIGVEEVAELEGRLSAAPAIDDYRETPSDASDESDALGEAVTDAEGDRAVGEAVADAEVEPWAEAEPAAATSIAPRYRPRFRLFRRAGQLDVAELETGPEAEQAAPPETAPVDDPEPATIEPEPLHTDHPSSTPGSPDWWRGPEVPPAAHPESSAPPPPPPAPEPPAADMQFSVAPRDGFHLTEFTDFVATPPSAPIETTPVAPGDKPEARGWHVRSSSKQQPDAQPGLEADELAEMLDADDWEQRRLLDLDPRLNDSRNEINDRLRRRRCDEAAALVQKVASEVGGRIVAELALDAGDRCRALGKGNAALSCYIAASRADPVFETPLLRLADVCLDDRDIDLAVTYLDRVARLHRMRGDTRGALRLYRKIATIAPYRDDILATLMRANSTGQFED